MAGFPKYPIPRYLHSTLWIINRNWRNNTIHCTVPLMILTLLIYRTLSLGIYLSPKQGQYTDPEEMDSPKKIVF